MRKVIGTILLGIGISASCIGIFYFVGYIPDIFLNGDPEAWASLGFIAVLVFIIAPAALLMWIGTRLSHRERLTGVVLLVLGFAAGVIGLFSLAAAVTGLQPYDYGALSIGAFISVPGGLYLWIGTRLTNLKRTALSAILVSMVVSVLVLGVVTMRISQGALTGAESGNWTRMSSGTKTNLHAVWGSSSSDVFAVGDGGTILHYDGNGWTRMSVVMESAFDQGAFRNLDLRGVGGSSPTDVFTAGGGSFPIMLHYDGQKWSNIRRTTGLWPQNIWSSSLPHTFAVNRSNEVLYYNGKTWNNISNYYERKSYYELRIKSVDNWITSVWGTSQSDVFAAWDAGTILHYDGDTWRRSTRANAGLLAVFGNTPSDVCAVGGDGTIIHYDGEAWSPIQSGTENRLFGAWGSSSSNVFAVGEKGVILHYDGKNWNNTSTSKFNLRGIWGSSSSDVFVVGDGGTILHYGR